MSYQFLRSAYKRDLGHRSGKVRWVRWFLQIPTVCLSSGWLLQTSILDSDNREPLTSSHSLRSVCQFSVIFAGFKSRFIAFHWLSLPFKHFHQFDHRIFFGYLSDDVSVWNFQNFQKLCSRPQASGLTFGIKRSLHFWISSKYRRLFREYRWRSKAFGGSSESDRVKTMLV